MIIQIDPGMPLITICLIAIRQTSRYLLYLTRVMAFGGEQ